MTRKKIAATRRNPQHKEQLPVPGSGSTPDPTPTQEYVPSELITKAKLRALRNLIQAKVLELERENFPGSWAWRHPAQ